MTRRSDRQNSASPGGAFTVHYRPGDVMWGSAPLDAEHKIDPQRLISDETTAAISIAYLHERDAWAVVDAEGYLMAESSSAADLTAWVSEYLDRLATEL